MDKIKLYHVSYNQLEPLSKIFTPKIPNNIWYNENDKIKRICLCDSIENCFTALRELPDTPLHSNKATVIVWEKEFSLSDKELKHWKYLYEENFVPDSALTHEYWYLKEIQMDGSYYEVTVDESNNSPRAKKLQLVPAKYKDCLLNLLKKYGVYINTKVVQETDACTLLNKLIPKKVDPHVFDIILSELKTEMAKEKDDSVETGSLRVYTNVKYKKITL